MRPCALSGDMQAEVRQGLDLLAAAEWYRQHLNGTLPIVVLSDRLAGQLCSAGGDNAEQQKSCSRVSRSRESEAAAAAATTTTTTEEEDAELEALLRQMHVGAAISSDRAAGALGSLLSSPMLGGGPTSGGTPMQLQLQQQRRRVTKPVEPGVHIMSAAEYFGGIALPPAVLDIYDSIAQSLAEDKEAASWGKVGGSGPAFPPHISQAALEAGLQDGSLLQGKLSMSRRDTSEGSVRIGSGELGGAGRQLLVSGRAALNRAVHGDTVVVRLLPREQWRPLDATAGAAPLEDEHDMMAAAAGGDGAETAADEAAEPGAATAAVGADDELDVVAALFSAAAADALLPCAEVVGVLSRSGAEVVACLAEEDEQALLARGESGRQESALCIPFDRRLPKLRLRSRQVGGQRAEHQRLPPAGPPGGALTALSPTLSFPPCSLPVTCSCTGSSASAWCCVWMAGSGAGAQGEERVNIRLHLSASSDAQHTQSVAAFLQQLLPSRSPCTRAGPY